MIDERSAVTPRRFLSLCSRLKIRFVSEFQLRFSQQSLSCTCASYKLKPVKNVLCFHAVADFPAGGKLFKLCCHEEYFFCKAVISISYLPIAPPVIHLSSLCATIDTSAGVKHIVNA